MKTKEWVGVLILAMATCVGLPGRSLRAETPSKFLNISTRLRVQTGENVLIGGFIITGTAAKEVLVRAIGPSLQGSGIQDFLPDPSLELHDSNGVLIATNDNWKINDQTQQSQEADIRATTIPPSNDVESAILATLTPNNGYTAIVRGNSGATGIAIVEAYDLDRDADSTLANISTRGLVETGNNVMIGGFILGDGPTSSTVIARALGPSLNQSGISNPLADPTLQLHDSNGVLLASNDNWADNPEHATQIIASGIEPQHGLESAIAATLSPGAYTAGVSDRGGRTGVGLIELYNINSSQKVIFQGEEAFLSGGVISSTAQGGYTGKGYITGFTSPKARAVFAVNVPVDGNYNVNTTYSNGSGGTRTLSVYVNGLQTTQALFAPSAEWIVKMDSIELRAGMNTIAYQYDNDDTGSIDIDGIEVDGARMEARGATLPYAELEAELANFNGGLVGPDTAVFTLPAEASGRRAIQLSSQGQYVEFTLTQPANAIVFRYSIPDAATGGGITAPIGVYINGTKSRDATLTSKYAYAYGPYPFNNNPDDGRPHHYFDDARLLLDQTYPAGTKITLQKDAADNLPLTIDLLDAEVAPPPYSRPANFVSITEYGATADDGTDDQAAIVNAINAAKAADKGVWLPAGTFNLNSARIFVNGVHIRGAGPWHSILAGPNAGFYGGGTDNSFQNLFYDFAIYGETDHRNDTDPDNGFDDNLGKGTVLQNIWVEHKKVGVWAASPTDGMYIVGCRVRNTYADGTNYAAGTANSRVEQSYYRNTGDDSLASWAATYKGPSPTSNNSFKFNTVSAPWFAQGIALYGGHAPSVTDNIVLDGSAGFGGGIHISTTFPMVPFSGTVVVARNTVYRGGGYEFDGRAPFGSIWISLLGGDIHTPVLITDNLIYGSTYSGFEIHGSGSITGLVVDGLIIYNAGTYGIEIREGAGGSGTFSDVVVINPAEGGLGSNTPYGFIINRGSGNSGW